MRKDQRIEALIDLIRDDGPTIHDGIQAIREMQAELEARETGTRVVMGQDHDCAWKTFYELIGRDAAVGETGGLRDKLRATEKEIECLKEELRIAENTWSFEEVKRIIGERDKLRDRLRDTAQALEKELTYSSNLRSENALMRIKITEAWKVIDGAPHA